MDERGSLAPVHNRGRKLEPVAASVHFQAPIVDNLYQDVREEPEHRRGVDEETDHGPAGHDAPRGEGELPKAAGEGADLIAPCERVGEAHAAQVQAGAGLQQPTPLKGA